VTLSLLNPNEQQAAEKAESSSLLPPGIYTCRVKEVSRWRTGTSLVWKFRVAKGQPLAGREVWSWTGLNDDSIFRTKEYLAALGFDLTASEDEIEGTPCKVNVQIEARTDTGEPANKVKKVFAYSGPELPEEDAEFTDDDIPFGDADDDLI